MLKSTWRSGHRAEDLVQNHFERQGYEVRARRWRAPFGEIDLWLSHSEKGDLFLEVKSLSHPDLILERVGTRQKKRLQRNIMWLAERFPKFCFRIVYVQTDGRLIELGPEDL